MNITNIRITIARSVSDVVINVFVKDNSEIIDWKRVGHRRKEIHWRKFWLIFLIACRGPMIRNSVLEGLSQKKVGGL